VALLRHTAISVAAVLAAWAAGLSPVWAAVAMSAYWVGREVAQAEYRYILYHTDTQKRADKPAFAVWRTRRAWDAKSFFWDMVLPAGVGIGLAVALVQSAGAG